MGSLRSPRPPAAAGAFYPDEPGHLASTVDRLLAEAGPYEGPAPKALIVPHAGYAYSGPIAAQAFRRLQRSPSSGGAPIRRVVLLGPAHRVSFRGLALPEAPAFATPLGEVKIDPNARAALSRVPGVIVSDAAHEGEHSLEVELPFLQRIIGPTSGEFVLVPLAVGEARGVEARQAIEALWGGEETAIVVSSDLSHYLDYETARSVDLRTTEKILSREAAALELREACGAIGINGLLLAARGRGLKAEKIDLRSSGDTAGPRHRVVGYGAFAFS